MVVVVVVVGTVDARPGVRRVISYKSLIPEQMDGESLKSDSLVTNQHGRIVLVAELKPIKNKF